MPEPAISGDEADLARAEILWAEAPSATTLGPAEVHIFAARLDHIPISPPGSALLSREERMRASRFHFQVHRSRFVAGRVLLRTVLSHYLGLDPAKIVFSYGKAGKPHLDPVHSASS